MIGDHLLRRQTEYSWALVILAGVLFGLGLVSGLVALVGAGIVVTAEEVVMRRGFAQRGDERVSASGSA